MAVRAKADIIKFQTFKAENIVTQNLERATYQKKSNKTKQTQYEMLRKLQLSEEDHIALLKYCNLKKIRFLSTPFDINSAKFLIDLGMKKIKIDGYDYDVPLYLISKKIPKIISKILIRKSLYFTRSIILNKFFIPNNLIFPTSRIILENYFN